MIQLCNLMTLPHRSVVHKGFADLPRLCCIIWVAVCCYLAIMENQIKKTMENDMKARVI